MKIFDRITAPFKGWRTVIFNAVSAAVTIMSLTEWRGIVPDDWMPYIALINALGNLYLRWRTTTPLGKKL